MNENHEYIEKHDYASKGLATTGAVLGGTSLGLNLLNGSLGALFGGWGNRNGWNNGCCNESHSINHDHALLAISERDARIARLESEKYSDGKTQELYNYTVAQNEKLSNFLCNVDKRLGSLETAAPLREQILDGKIAQVADKAACCCAASNAAISNLSALVTQITKTVVPLGAVCPQPMPQYNSWTAPTAVAPTSVVVTPTATPATGA